MVNIFEDNLYPSSGYAVGVMIAWLIPRLFVDWNRAILAWKQQQQQQQQQQQRQSQQKLPGATKEKTNLEKEDQDDTETKNENEKEQPTTIRIVQQQQQHDKGDDDDENENDNDVKDNNNNIKEKEELKSLHQTAVITLVVLTFLLLIATMLSSAFTDGLDPNMVLILAGLSRIASAGVLIIISLELPQWLGVYDYLRLIREEENQKEESSITISRAALFRTAHFNLIWSMIGQFARIFWIVMVFSGGLHPTWYIPITWIWGTALGVALTLTVYYGRKKTGSDFAKRQKYAFITMTILVVCGCIAFSFGCAFIQEVWVDQQEQDDDDDPENKTKVKSNEHHLDLIAVSLLVSLFISGLVHYAANRLSKKRCNEKEIRRQESEGGEQQEGNGAGVVIHDNEFASDLFSPETLNHAKSEIMHLGTALHQGTIGTAAATIASNDHNKKRNQQQQQQHDKDTSTATYHDEVPPSDTGITAADTTMSGEGGGGDEESTMDIENKEQDATTGTGRMRAVDEKEKESSSADPPITIAGGSSACAVSEMTMQSVQDSTCTIQSGNTNCDAEAHIESGTKVDEELAGSTIGGVILQEQPQSGEQQQPDVNQYIYDNDNEKEDQQQQLPSYCTLCLTKLKCCKCCCRPCGIEKNNGPFAKLNRRGQIIISIKWFLRFILHGLCAYLAIVNIGATQQGNYAKELFPSVHVELYEGQESGPVCAYSEPYVDEHTRTFDNVTEALSANFSIAHCGACNHCSTWQNLRLQWTTRHNLAILSQKCAKVLVFQGYEKALDCHLETIGFDVPCSDCWIEVEACAAKHCVFIQMQAWTIARLGNFEVGPDVVTAAMCEEAICEVDFVPCSGANRRRMNIVSDIDRPGDQQCPLVPESNDKWLGLFGPEDPPIE